MADLDVKTQTRKYVDGIDKEIVLNVGEKLADDSELIALANKTVPLGYKVTVRVRIYPYRVEEV